MPDKEINFSLPKSGEAIEIKEKEGISHAIMRKGMGLDNTISTREVENAFKSLEKETKEQIKILSLEIQTKLGKNIQEGIIIIPDTKIESKKSEKQNAIHEYFKNKQNETVIYKGKEISYSEALKTGYLSDGKDGKLTNAFYEKINKNNGNSKTTIFENENGGSGVISNNPNEISKNEIKVPENQTKITTTKNKNSKTITFTTENGGSGVISNNPNEISKNEIKVPENKTKITTAENKNSKTITFTAENGASGVISNNPDAIKKNNSNIDIPENSTIIINKEEGNTKTSIFIDKNGNSGIISSDKNAVFNSDKNIPRI